jgi:hypothetical protein
VEWTGGKLPLDADEERKWVLRILGAGGGSILAPCHVLQTDVPTENILAMSDVGVKAASHA